MQYRYKEVHLDFNKFSIATSSFISLVGMIPSAISATTSARRLMDFFDLSNENLLDDEKIKYINKNTKGEGLSVEISKVMFNYDENKLYLKMQT